MTAALSGSACDGPREAPRVELAVFVDSSGLEPVTTDLGYLVELDEARAAVRDLEFTVAGEVHASENEGFLDLFVSVAHAHPGHEQGGEVAGELRGQFVLDWLPARDEALGTATLLGGAYVAANFTFARAEAVDAGSDLFAGHTALLRGRATRDSFTTEFVALLDSPADRSLVGAPFELIVKEDSEERLGVRLLTRDPYEDDTLFDGIDFEAADADDDGQLVILEGSAEPAVVDAYNFLRRAFQAHDHFDVLPSDD